jgi:predicted MFS family arabinose efflux permease
MSDAPKQEWQPRHSPWLITLTVMMAVFMEVLDTSIANIALPHIAGSLSATPEEATWVLTSYLVANAIVLPMTGWLGNHFGRKRVLLTCIVLFTFASALVRPGVEPAGADCGADFAGRRRRRDGANRAIHHA